MMYFDSIGRLQVYILAAALLWLEPVRCSSAPRVFQSVPTRSAEPNVKVSATTTNDDKHTDPHLFQRADSTSSGSSASSSPSSISPLTPVKGMIPFYANYSSFYTVNITLGGQSLHNLILNTADDLVAVFDGNYVSKCSSTVGYIDCAYGDVYDSSDSKTFWYSDQMFKHQLLDNNVFSGALVEDTLHINGQADWNYQNFTFGLIENTTVSFPGQVGIGKNDYMEGADHLVATAIEYLNSSVYSLFRVDAEGSAMLLLGGVDTDYFDNLYVSDMNPVQNDANNRTTNPWIFITLVDITAAKDSVSQSILDSTLSLSVMLDTGNLFSYLPFQAVVNIAVQIGAVYYEQEGAWLQACNYRNASGIIIMVFESGANIPIPIDKLLIPIYDSSGDAIKFSDGSGVCMLTFMSSDNLGYSSLGMNVLQGVYMAIDSINGQIGIAPLHSSITNITMSDITTTQDLAQRETSTASQSSTASASIGLTTASPAKSRGMSFVSHLTDVEGAIYSTTTSYKYATVSKAGSNFTDWGNRFPLMTFSNNEISAQYTRPTAAKPNPNPTSSIEGVGGVLPDASTPTTYSESAAGRDRPQCLFAVFVALTGLISYVI